MSPSQFFDSARTVTTPSGRISYVERGSGPVALFVHGMLLNGWLWRHQLDGRRTYETARRIDSWLVLHRIGRGDDIRPGRGDCDRGF